jgi:hypothetical protein
MAFVGKPDSVGQSPQRHEARAKWTTRSAPIVGVGVYANRPVAGQTGRIFMPTDGYCRFFDDGALWRLFFEGIIGTSPSVSSSSSTVNMPSASNLSDDKGTPLFTNPSLGTGTNRVVKAYSIPTPPYTLRVRYSVNNTIISANGTSHTAFVANPDQIGIILNTNNADSRGREYRCEYSIIRLVHRVIN